MEIAVISALVSAGWREGRVFDESKWVQFLESQEFIINGEARRLWREYGGLHIKSDSSREPSSSLKVDPIDSSSAVPDDAISLERIYGENYSPIGFWSNQFPAYIAASGRVVAIGPVTDWELGESFESALSFIVIGGRPNRQIGPRKTPRRR